jgi:two-component system phosphate regulon response regulator PhoB
MTLDAGGGQEALETLLLHPVDLVLMDTHLPGMDGFDVTRVIRSQPKTASLPIVLVSARLDRNRFSFGIQSGATDFLAKPLDLDAMIGRVWNILEHRGFMPPTDNVALSTILRNAPSEVQRPLLKKRPDMSGG